jgi:DNA-binding HxlR family transcriptional regulator
LKQAGDGAFPDAGTTLRGGHATPRGPGDGGPAAPAAITNPFVAVYIGAKEFRDVEPVSARRAGTELPSPSATVAVAAGPEGRLEELFRRFREPVVRLVEQVTDELPPSPGPAADARRDIRLVRSTFGKWSAELLVSLHATPAAGFEDLRRSLTGISARVLSIKLNELEENGWVHREILDTHPPRVRYSLTDRGWTIAWLTQPILLYLRSIEHRRPAMGEPRATVPVSESPTPAMAANPPARSKRR